MSWILEIESSVLLGSKKFYKVVVFGSGVGSSVEDLVKQVIRGIEMNGRRAKFDSIK